MTFIDLLKKNPGALSKYVSLGFAVVDKAVMPLNKLMHHLLEVQGIDPNTKPGEKARRELEDAIGNVCDPVEYESDFDFSRFHAKYKKVQSALGKLNLSKEQYRKLTDLSNLSDKPASQPLQRTKNEIALFATPEGRTELRAKLASDDQNYHVDDQPTKFSMKEAMDDYKAFTDGDSNPIEELKEFTSKYDVSSLKGVLTPSSLKEAVQTLSKFAQKQIKEEEGFTRPQDTLEYKMERAKKLCDMMIKRGICDSSKKAVDAQIDEIMLFSSDALDSLERVVKRRGEVSQEKVDAARSPTSVFKANGASRTSKVKSNVVKTFKNGLFRRVDTK